MPELPEVETVCLSLAHSIKGVKVKNVQFFCPRLRIDVPQNADAVLRGRKIIAVARRAKYILIQTDNHFTIVIHLGMSGLIKIDTPLYKRVKHDHFVMTLTTGLKLILNDPRRFSLIKLVPTADIEKDALFCHLGVEPLSRLLSKSYLQICFHNSKRRIKQILLDQSVVVGIGNIYACEILYDCRVNPSLPASLIKEYQILGLIKSIRRILKKAIAAGGSSLRDYKHTDGSLGYFLMDNKVYNREGQACKRCKDKIKKIVQSNRSTFFCPHCQKE